MYKEKLVRKQTIQMNLHELLTIIGLVSNIILGLYIFYLNPKEKLSRLYIIVTSTLVVWCAGDFIFSIANSRLMAEIGDDVSTYASYFACVFLLYFFLEFTKHHIKNKLFIFLISAPFLLMITLHSFITQIFVKGYVLTNGTYYGTPGSLFALDMTLELIYVVFSLVLSFKFYINSKNRKSFKEMSQARLLIVAVATPLIYSFAVEIIPSFFGKNFISESSFVTSISAIIVAYAIVKHDLLVITPAKAVDNIIRTMADLLIVFDYNKKVVIVDEAILEITGKKESELIGLHFQSLPLELSELFEQLSSSSFVKNYESQLVRPNLQKIDVSINASTMKDKNGAPIGYVLLMRDVTENKRLIQLLMKEKASVEKKVEDRTKELIGAKADLSASIDSLPLGYLMTDSSDHVILTNSIARKVLSSGTEESYLDVLKRLLITQNINFDEYLKNSATEKSRLTVDELMINGRYYQFLLAPILVKDDNSSCIGIVVLIQDITEAKILNRSKDEFFSIASQELRTPLTTIRGNALNLLEYHTNLLKDPAVHQLVDDVYSSSVRLVDIVSNFLDMSSLELDRVSFDIRPTSASEVAKIVQNDLTQNARKVGVTLKVSDNLNSDILPMVMVDVERFKQILYNLIDNALRFTQSGGTVLVDGYLDEDQLMITVTDEGEGIPEELQGLLFHKFQQVGESLFTQDGSKGTGLGLYISRLLAQKMGGDLYLEQSEVNMGSTFTIKLPIEKASEKVAIS
ncbi:MAG TPA: ATP-binding protein [Patescibacteria group bacterium]|nr:ATP-binding protein [Patescibacteria group bacterium]